MFIMSQESRSTEADCDYQAYLEWEKVLATKNLRYYWKSYSRRLCDTEEYASESMRGAVTWVLDRRYGEKIRGWRSRELFANEELAKLAAKREAAKVMQMATQVTSWAQANRSSHASAQPELLPFFEPGAPSGSHTAPSATKPGATEQVSIWPGTSVDERDDEDETDGETEEPVLSVSETTVADADEGDDDTEDGAAAMIADVATEARASSSRIVPKELVEESSAFAAANPVPQSDIEAALSRHEVATATDAVPLSSWTAQLLWTQSGEVSLAPWFGVKWPSPLSSTASSESSGEIDTAIGTEESHDSQTEPPDES